MVFLSEVLGLVVHGTAIQACRRELASQHLEMGFMIHDMRYFQFGNRMRSVAELALQILHFESINTHFKLPQHYTIAVCGRCEFRVYRESRT